MNNIDSTLLHNYIYTCKQLEKHNKQAIDLKNKKKSIENKLIQMYSDSQQLSVMYRQYEVSIKKQNQYQNLTQDHIKTSLHKYFKNKSYSDDKIKYYTDEIMNIIIGTRIKQNKKILHVKKKDDSRK